MKLYTCNSMIIIILYIVYMDSAVCTLDFIVESAPCSPRCGFLSSLPYTLLYRSRGFAIGLAKQHFVPLVVSPKKGRRMVITGPLEGGVGGPLEAMPSAVISQGSCLLVLMSLYCFRRATGLNLQHPCPLSHPLFTPSARRRLLSGFLSGAMFCTPAQAAHCLDSQLPLAKAPRP